MNSLISPRVFAIVVAMVIIAFSASCGGSGGGKGPASTAPVVERLSGELADVISELNDLQPPPQVDADIFETLKSELAQALSSRSASKFASTPPTGDDNVVDDLEIASQDGTQISLTWSYRNVGDYNQDGVVSIQDITPLAEHFFHQVGDDPFDGIIDGSKDGTISIQDITPLAQNFFAQCAMYHVQGAPTSDGNFEDVLVVQFASAQGKEVGRATFTTDPFEIGENRWFRVRPADSDHNLGAISSPLVRVTTNPPDLTGVIPTTGLSGSDITFTPTVTGNQPFFNWQWSFIDSTLGEWASPATSTERNPTVTLTGGAGTYSGSVSVDNAYGSDEFDFSFEITVSGNPPVINSIGPPGGAKGRQVDFYADVSGDEPITYEWSFPEGFLPRTSLAENPRVTLPNTEGEYQASLTVRNDIPAEDTENFTITVTSGNNPPTVTLTINGSTATAVASDPDFDKLSFDFAISPVTVAATVFVNPSASIPPTNQYTQVMTLKNLSLKDNSGQLNVTVTDETSLTANDFKPFSLDGLTGPPNSVNVAFSNNSPKVGDEISVLIYVYDLQYEFYQLPYGVTFDFTKNLSLVEGSLNIGEIIDMVNGEPDGIWVNTSTRVPALNIDNDDLANITATDGDEVIWYVNDVRPFGRWGVWTLKMAPLDDDNPVYTTPPGIDGAVLNLKLRAENSGTAYFRIYKQYSYSPGGPYVNGTAYITFVENPQDPPPLRYMSDASYQDVALEILP